MDPLTGPVSPVSSVPFFHVLVRLPLWVPCTWTRLTVRKSLSANNGVAQADRPLSRMDSGKSALLMRFALGGRERELVVAGDSKPDSTSDCPL